MKFPTKSWMHPGIWIIATLVVIVGLLFWQVQTPNPTLDGVSGSDGKIHLEFTTKSNFEFVQLLLRVFLFFPIVGLTLWIAFLVYEQILEIKNQQLLNDTYFKDMQSFLGDKEAYADKDVLLKSIIQILKTIDEKKNNDVINEKKKYFDIFLFLLTYTAKEINLSLKGNRNGKYSIRLNNSKSFIEIWEKGLDCTKSSFFALNYPTDTDSFGRKDDPSSLKLQKNSVNEVKNNRGNFVRVFVYDKHDKDELKRLFSIMCNQKKIGIDVKIIEEKEFDTTFFDEIKTIESENFCLINSSFLIIFKLNQFGIREECEITFDTEKIQAAHNVIAGLTSEVGKQKDFIYSELDLPLFLNDVYIEEGDKQFEFIENKYESVKTMIVLAELENALLSLQEIVKGNKESEDRVIMLLSRYNGNKKKLQIGAIESSNASMETNQISHSTLQLIEEFINSDYKNAANNALNGNRRQKPPR